MTNNNINPGSRNKKGLKRGQKIAMAGTVIAFLLLVWGVYAHFDSKAERYKPCETLKEREKLVAASIEEYKTKRKKSMNQDYNERVYDFKIAYANAVLQNIRDSLNLLLCEK